MKTILSILLVAAASSAAFANTDKWDWVKTSKGKSSNALVSSIKKSGFLSSEVPAYEEDFGFQIKNKKSKLDEALLTVLGGPPDDSIQTDENSVFLSACRAQSCDEKGFFWANAKDKTSVMGILHYQYQGKLDGEPQLFLASKHYKCNQYPAMALSQIKGWLGFKNVNPNKVRCLQDGQVVDFKL